MKKVGLITFHDTANHGAALQLFATLKAISSFGYNAEVIDYTNPFRQTMYNAKLRLKSELSSRHFIPAIKTLIGYRLINRRMKAFDEFYSKYTKRSHSSYVSREQIQTADLSTYDGFVCGSDQIWSPKNSGEDTTYLLDFVEDKSKCFSYASSLGSVCIEESLENQYKKLLSKFPFKSVRERTGSEVLKNITGEDFEVVLDPVFLLTSEQWLDALNLQNLQRTPQEGLLVDYTAKKGQTQRFLNHIQARKCFSRIEKFGTALSLSDMLAKSIDTKLVSDPKDLIASLLKCEMLYTSSFHGTVLAIIFKVPFVVVLSGDKGRDSRIVDLLEQFGLEDRIFSENINVDSTIDFEKVHRVLDEKRNKSLDYLQNALRGVCSHNE